MLARRIALGIGIVLVLVGIGGLLTRVSVSPGLQTVSCGTAVAPDFTEAEQARPLTQAPPMEMPFSSELAGDADYPELCRTELADRRAWTITAGVTGVVVLVAAGALMVRARRSSPAEH